VLTKEEEIEVLQAKIDELEKEVETLRKRTLISKGKTVNVPDQFKPIFDKAQETVGRYFENLKFSPQKGTIEINEQRYVLVRASALSHDFLTTIQQLYADRGEKQALNIGKNFLFDISRVIGMNDAKKFHEKMGLSNPIEKLSAGPVHFAYSGWAFVDILPESAPSPDENCFLTYHHPFSFEADSWIRAGKKSEIPVCIMSSGYSSGWCQESFGIELTAVEVSCKACGDENCTFIMAPPGKINEHLNKYFAQKNISVNESSAYDIPTFFERKKVEEEMERSRIKAEESDRAKSDFLANMSHEIRTPLNAIIGYVDLILEDDISEEHKEYLGTVKESGHLLQHVIDDILDLSKIEAGQLVIDKINYPVKTIFDYIEDTARSLLMQKKSEVKLVRQIDSAIPEYIITDPIRLQQIMYNLVSNAIKFTENGKIEFGVKLYNERTLDFYVKDTGVGIPRGKHGAIFEKFGQADASVTRKYGGSGLGLTISKKLAELMGGTISLQSSETSGSLFSFTHPLIYETKKEAGKNSLVTKKNIEREQTALLVEDNLINLRLTQKVLEKKGIKVFTAKNGELALELFKKEQGIDFVIMDLQMPVMDGLTAIRLMREFEKEKELRSKPAIALTAHAMKGDMESCLEAGFNSYISKPFSIDVLLRTIGELVRT
jgi:CheY-like chemotaxis protein